MKRELNTDNLQRKPTPARRHSFRFRAHDTFFIRKGWLAKGVKHVAANPAVFLRRGGANPMDTLGIGANMVKALRYWMVATGITKEVTRREQEFTDFGKNIRTHDPYFEELGTLWLLHYRLASNRSDAPAWWWFYNEFRLSEFSRDDFVTQIDRWLRMQTNDEQTREVPMRYLAGRFVGYCRYVRRRLHAARTWRYGLVALRRGHSTYA